MFLKTAVLSQIRATHIIQVTCIPQTWEWLAFNNCPHTILFWSGWRREERKRGGGERRSRGRKEEKERHRGDSIVEGEVMKEGL
jgi:hypothetical protein